MKVQLQRIADGGYDELDVRFTDIRGYWRHVTIPASDVSEELFTRGVGFDGSTLDGMTSVDAGDLVLLPDPRRTFEDPFTDRPTLAIFANVFSPETGKPFDRDPRSIARKALIHLRASGVATDSFWSPEFEFYLFDRASFWSEPGACGYELGSMEGPSGGKDPGACGLVHSTRSGYHMMTPVDSLHDIRSEMAGHMRDAGLRVKYHHHEVGRMGQCELEVRFAPFLSAADSVMITKHIARSVALEHGLAATFMPKPLPGEPGSGMHFHLYMTDKQEPIFYDRKGYCSLSDAARSAIAGILHHAPAVCAFTNPTVNSYRRLVPGQEAPVYRFFSGPNRSASVRVPSYARSPESIRFEYRVPDGSCNPYLAMSAIQMAAVDGMKRGLDPTKLGFGPLDVNAYEEGVDTSGLSELPPTLEEALDALEGDMEFLMDGEVFTGDFIQAYMSIKRREAAEFYGNPHPLEHKLYFGL